MLLIKKKVKFKKINKKTALDLEKVRFKQKTIKVKWNRQHAFDQERRIQEKSDKDQEKRICGIWKTQIRIKNSASKYIQFGLIGRIGKWQ